MSRSENARKKAKADALLAVTVHDVLKAINSPRSLCVWMLYHYDEHMQLVELSIDPLHYNSAESFADDYQATKLLSKYPFLNTGIDTELEGQQAFVNAERQCRETNIRLNTSNPQGACYSVIRLARKIIAETLDGHSDAAGFSPDCIPYILRNIGWGPGVTSSAKGNNLSSYHKLQSDLELTTELSRLPIQMFIDGVSVWSTPDVEVKDHDGESVWVLHPSKEAVVSLRPVHGNKVTFVPKNAKTDRPIAVEPHLNALFQKGIGKFIAGRLRSTLGINLRDQGRNQHLAELGSRYGHLATLDLKSASDTVAQGCVELLLPHHWVTLLNCVRSQNYVLDDEVWNRYHKHSSMGNGYTFELESLIFASLTKATIQFLRLENTTYSIYGDDIIAPVEATQLLTEVLEYVGFTLNTEKSFSSGPFRESCGKDYFLGVNVRPFFIKERPDSITNVFQLVNAIRRYSHMRNSSMACDARFFRAWRNLFKSLPKKYRHFRGPDGHGDGWIIGNFDECAQHISTKYKRLYQRVQYRVKCRKFSALRLTKEIGSYAVASALFDTQVSDNSLGLSTEYRVEPKDYKPEAYCDIGPELDSTVFSPRKRGRWTDCHATVLRWRDLGAWL